MRKTEASYPRGKKTSGACVEQESAGVDPIQNRGSKVQKKEKKTIACGEDGEQIDRLTHRKGLPYRYQ